MAVPNSLRSARLTNATLGSSIDDEIGLLERALCDILGIPIDTDIAAALFARFRSRRDHTFAEKMLSALRSRFGGHLERPPGR